MNNVRTVFSTESEQKHNMDWKHSPGYRIDGKVKQPIEIDSGPLCIDTCTPTDLSSSQAFELFENLEPRQWSEGQKIRFKSTFSTEGLEGKILLRALTDTKLKEEILQQLKLNIKTKTEFNDFLNELKKRQEEIDSKNKTTATDSAIPTVAPKVAKPQHVQNITNSESVIGQMNNHSTHQNVNTNCKYYATDPNMQ